MAGVQSEKSSLIFDYAKWEPQLETLKKQYKGASPFPSIVLEDFINPEMGKKVIAEFPSPSSKDWTHYVHVNEKKLAQTKRALIPPQAISVIDELNSPPFIRFISELTGVEGLIPDPDLEGGGCHQIQKGGFLNIHADFTAHPHRKNWARRVNVLIYLNKNWEDEYGGYLQLWDQKAQHCVKKILPVFNRCVVFSTDPDSFHGHPEPLTCPEGWTRKSIALYYFTETNKPFVRSTEYRAQPSDRWTKRLFMYIDKMGLRFFDFLKRKFGLKNERASRLLRIFFR